MTAFRSSSWSMPFGERRDTPRITRDPLEDYGDEPRRILDLAYDYMSERGYDAETAIKCAREYVAGSDGE